MKFGTLVANIRKMFIRVRSDNSKMIKVSQLINIFDGLRKILFIVVNSTYSSRMNYENFM